MAKLLSASLLTLGVAFAMPSAVAQTASQTITFVQHGFWFDDGAPSSFFIASGVGYTTGLGTYSYDTEWNWVEVYNGYRSVREATGSLAAAGNHPYNPLMEGTFASSSGEFFSLDSLWLAGAWGSMTLSITGYANGAVINTAAIYVDMAAQEYFFSGFEGIDSFSITVGDDFEPDPSFYGFSGMQHPNPFLEMASSTWALGGITITTAVPEPETYAMLLAGLGVVGAIARRRRVKAAA